MYGLAVHCHAVPYQPAVVGRETRQGRSVSHSVSVGSRASCQRAKASASYQLTWSTGSDGSTGTRPASPKRCQCAVVVLPVLGRLPAQRLHRVPAVGHPQLGTAVAAVVHERQPLPARHERTGPCGTAAAGPRGAGPRCRRRTRRRRGRPRRCRRRGRTSRRRPARVGPWPRQRPVGGAQRVARQHVLDVHDEQLLVLLLVVQAELEQLGGPRRDRSIEQLAHRDVDVLAVPGDLGAARPRDQAALGAGVPRPDRLVVGVEEEPERASS